ncbi:MAG TPA: glycosyltransferase family 4 protein [Candidatus Saccharimonadales bacterium]|nr:glycosyltransferase family 4 protein [Candidatus Saccharimonadales bacterium]
MKIVQISSLWETTPPTKYGGLELVVSNLTEELISQGHEVTLFATGDSKTNGKLIGTYPHSLYRDGVPWTSMYDTLHHISEAIRYADQWGADIIHNHLSHRSLAMMALAKTPHLNTIHGTVDIKEIPDDIRRTFMAYKDQNFVSISHRQRTFAKELNWMANAYNGIDVAKFPFNPKPKADYLLWIGRITPNKAPHLAIKYAKAFGLKLIMAAKLDQHAPKDLEYYEKVVKPLLKRGEAEWLGEVGFNEKVKLYRDAYCLLNPIQWEEPFGLVVAEAMACGTPVVAYDRGAMGEIIVNDLTGILVRPDDEKGFVAAIKRAPELNRAASRAVAENRFSVQAMTKSYLEAYQQVMKK